MAQTYAVVYTKEGNFFIATKNMESYFYGDGTNGNIYPNGDPIPDDHGPGLMALPGGTKNNNESYAFGAKREFMEETGVDISDMYSLSPASYVVNNGHTTLYAGVYFLVSTEDFITICDAALGNFVTASLVADDISQHKIESYQDIFTYLDGIYKNCPFDNELASGMIWNLDLDWAQIDALEDSDKTDWYYEILNNLKDNFPVE